jgi:acetate kinase
MKVLAVNAGSSSLKLSLIGEAERPLQSTELELQDGELASEDLDEALSGSPAGAEAVGHRIVHGGRRFTAAVRIDVGVRDALGELSDLAPLHQRKSLLALDAVAQRLPQLPAVACFDTAFHAQMPAEAATYALPARWRQHLAIHRYGFHGLSHAWVAERSAQLLGAPPERLVSAHLGSGASLCAIDHGASIDTTMGFTPLEGLAMATRSGSVDPGLLLWLLEHREASERELADALEHESGLLGLCGSADMREVLRRAGEGERSAQLALDVYLHRLAAGIASMAAALGGIDALAFTGGVGERSAQIRSLTAKRLAFLGVAIARDLNESEDADREISAGDASVRTLVVEAREDLEIARQTRAVLEQAG